MALCGPEKPRQIRTSPIPCERISASVAARPAPRTRVPAHPGSHLSRRQLASGRSVPLLGLLGRRSTCPKNLPSISSPGTPISIVRQTYLPWAARRSTRGYDPGKMHWSLFVHEERTLVYPSPSSIACRVCRHESARLQTHGRLHEVAESTVSDRMDGIKAALEGPRAWRCRAPLVDELTALLERCIQAGRAVADLADPATLQWIAREIGDVVFPLTGRYPDTAIEPYASEVDQFDRNVVQEFARVFDIDGNARALLERVGYPRAQKSLPSPHRHSSFGVSCVVR